MADSFDFIWHGEQVLRSLEANKRRGLRKAAEFVLAESKEHVPYREGILENSGGVDSDDKEATVFYDTRYAVRLHENPHFNFRGKGRGKWLQIAAEKSNEKVHRILAEEIGRGLR